MKILRLLFLVLAAAALAAADAPPVSGSFTGNGKEAKLAFATALKGDRFSDKETITLIFTEKDHSKEKKPENKAGFGDFGSALIVKVFHDGKIFGCEVKHLGLPRGPFSSIGTLTMSDFRLEGGMLEGKLSTGGPTDTFGQKWDVNISFRTKAP